MNIKKNSTLVTEDFTRFEFKYLLRKEESQTIEEEVRHFMSIDGYVDPDMDQKYYVRSLYFDTPDSHCFYEKIDGVKSRQKFRLRTYARSEKEPAPVFLEIKGRHNERTYKHRVRIDRETLPLFLKQDLVWQLLEIYPGSDVIEQFVYDVVRQRIAPMVLVDYRRRPYNSIFDINFRMTFDQDVTGTAANHLFPDKNVQAARKCVAGWTILEVKFHRRIPPWFHRIIQAHSMRRISISKFVLGMKRCDIAQDLS